ncbi:MAG: alpha/beta hydrolase fold domain-containing protein [Bacteroidia bacterium]
MKKQIFTDSLYAFLACILLTITNNLMAQNTRYKNEIFTQVKTDSNITYAQNINLYNKLQPLQADVYSPVNDTNKKRPLIIFMHGGAFYMGSRKDDYVVQVCRQFAQRGYVTASISYRLGIENMYSPMAFGEAIYRATQDAKAAVRYFRANAEKYGIDADKIIIGGGSAGAITALHAAYWQQHQVPSYINTEKLGQLNDAGGNAGIADNVLGVVNCWGAVIDTSYLKKSNIPVVSIHGESDSIVPYKTAGFGGFNLYGSYYIHEQAQKNGIKSVLKAFPNTGHGLQRSDTVKWNTTVATISDFLYELVADTQKDNNTTHTGLFDFDTNKKEGAVIIYPNPTKHIIAVKNNRNTGVKHIAMTYIGGNEVLQRTETILPQQTANIHLPQLSQGIYLLSIIWTDDKKESEKIQIR